jgi:serine/threonine protein kinase
VSYVLEISKVVHPLPQRLRKEILVWRMLDHPNIVPLIGITFDFGRNSPMGMVCPWLEKGNLNGYLDRCGTALEIFDRFKIVSSETF